ncbi:DUF3732 domain-containing protein [Methylomonas koyamae]
MVTLESRRPSNLIAVQRLNYCPFQLSTSFKERLRFSHRNRPIPRFLFLDQPSQVYFPPEREIAANMTVNDLKEDDRSAVKRMFQYVFEAVEAASLGFQVILTEHADIDEEWYQSAVVERWRSGLKLVPADWPSLGNTQ